MTASSLLSKLLYLGFAGAVGTLARVGVYAACDRPPLNVIPSATLFVNVAGSFLFGIIWPLAERTGVGETALLSPGVRWLLLAGFMGAFTTFSTFAFETGRYLQEGRPGAAALNLAANNLLGIGAFLLGWHLSHRL